MSERINKDLDFVITIEPDGCHELIKADGEVERTMTATITSANPDRVNDRVLPGAFINIGKDGSRIPILWSHIREELPIGKTQWVKNDRKNETVVMKMVFAPTAKAIEAYELVKGGFISNVSVGMNVLEYNQNANRGWDISKAELLEVSLVNIPANRDAVITGIKGFMSKGITFTDSTLKEFAIEIIPEPAEMIEIEKELEIESEPESETYNVIDDLEMIKSLILKIEKGLTTPSGDENVEESEPVTATSDEADEPKVVEESGKVAATSDNQDADEEFIIIEGEENE